MIWQWVIITVCVVLAAGYLAGVIRKTIKQPYCSDCPGCKPKKGSRGWGLRSRKIL